MGRSWQALGDRNGRLSARLDGKGKPGGKLRFLEDTNGDGVCDKSTAFMDGLTMPTGLYPWRKGVLMVAAPDSFYAEDSDGDGKADVKKVLFTGFHPGNPQHRANDFTMDLTTGFTARMATAVEKSLQLSPAKLWTSTIAIFPSDRIPANSNPKAVELAFKPVALFLAGGAFDRTDILYEFCLIDSVWQKSLIPLRMKSSLRSPIVLFLIVIVGSLLMTGCETRSISSSGYGGRYGHPGNPFYRGELSEFDLLGLQRGADVTDAEISKALDSAQKVKLTKGGGLLLVQSGAIVPDEPMLAELNKYFAVTPFSGQPPETNSGSYSKSLRLAAAQAGCGNIVCYWGALESASKDLDTKAVSWVPIVGGALPDQSQHMRIRLKMAIVNVRNGRWTQFVPQPFENRAISGEYRRKYSDQTQVETLKRQAYEAAVNDLLKIYGS